MMSLSNTQLRKAARSNPKYARRLGWLGRYNQISHIFGFTNMSPGPHQFAESAARWQRKQGLADDGMIGPNTWRKLRPYTNFSIDLAATPPAWMIERRRRNANRDNTGVEPSDTDAGNDSDVSPVHPSRLNSDQPHDFWNLISLPSYSAGPIGGKFFVLDGYDNRIRLPREEHWDPTARMALTQAVNLQRYGLAVATVSGQGAPAVGGSIPINAESFGLTDTNIPELPGPPNVRTRYALSARQFAGPCLMFGVSASLSVVGYSVGMTMFNVHPLVVAQPKRTILNTIMRRFPDRVAMKEAALNMCKAVSMSPLLDVGNLSLSASLSFGPGGLPLNVNYERGVVRVDRIRYRIYST